MDGQCPPVDCGSCPPTQSRVIAVLTDLYWALGGQSWTRSDDWLDPGADLCTWYGLTCLNSGPLPYRLRIDLPSNNLRGSLPPSIANLTTALVLLYLYDNRLAGEIPDVFENLTALVL